ncbi:MAG: hypothetical protein D6748_16270 [Calditrichaeota bacterium]|nr:MAG: hypothetical protein D6748_16270 [Calditrichota bacterium]
MKRLPWRIIILMLLFVSLPSYTHAIDFKQLHPQVSLGLVSTDWNNRSGALLELDGSIWQSRSIQPRFDFSSELMLSLGLEFSYNNWQLNFQYRDYKAFSGELTIADFSAPLKKVDGDTVYPVDATLSSYHFSAGYMLIPQYHLTPFIEIRYSKTSFTGGYVSGLPPDPLPELRFRYRIWSGGVGLQGSYPLFFLSNLNITARGFYSPLTKSKISYQRDTIFLDGSKTLSGWEAYARVGLAFRAASFLIHAEYEPRIIRIDGEKIRDTFHNYLFGITFIF